MQSITNPSKLHSSPGLKQVKVDNWGTFFLQRLQQLYADEELLDLTIKFPTSDITVQAHRLVITTCTDYFTQLERKQKEQNENFDGILIMPTDMPYECVKSIISFMYTGQLDYWTSEQNALYRTAQKMNMTVLTKLLDAQFSSNIMQSPSTSNNDNKPMENVKVPTLVKKISPNQPLPTTPLPGRKLPIWRRKIDNYSSPINSDFRSYGSYGKRQANVTSGPSRFDLPEVEDIALGVFSSFDDITYNTKPIVQATGHSTSTSSNSGDRFTDHSPTGADELSRNYKPDDDDDDYDAHDSNNKHWDNSDDDWIVGGPKSILRPQEVHPSPSKRVRFELEEKENMEKRKNMSPQNSADAINNHAKIIREVLKKYPHLVKNNKNIRLKIMQKESKSSVHTSGKTKVSYVVLKSDHLMPTNSAEEEKKKDNMTPDGETGPWKCHKCDLEEEYPNYYMYRRHMQDVHDEKFDPRVCEHCGYKATKRNILMFHLYTKHNVPPPKSMSFPKCHACNYVALSDTLMVRHQINQNHRPISSRSHSMSANEIHCVQCGLGFKDVIDLTNHEVTTGHGSAINGKDKGFRCSQCPKVFARSTNLKVHMDCVHKNLREPEPPAMLSIPLEPSSEAEALSNVASGIAASLSVGESIIPDQMDIHTSASSFIANDMSINTIAQDQTYNGHDIEGQQMIMLIDNENYHHQQDDMPSNLQPQPQQLEISSNEQLVMQGTDEGMIVYIHGNDEQANRETYQTYHEEVAQETEEIVEEVVEEVEEEVLDEESNQEPDNNSSENSAVDEHVEEVIQYVEEETEIVEYDEEQTQSGNDNQESQESMMIIEEEEHIDHDNENNEKESQRLADEWDEEDSIEMAES
ncbi:hypothetical protein PV327_007638 [Microctonus hyperodae]|nr:hypothetical protein PV327_007638 [Microctonus hyperodae]